MLCQSFLAVHTFDFDLQSGQISTLGRLYGRKGFYQSLIIKDW